MAERMSDGSVPGNRTTGDQAPIRLLVVDGAATVHRTRAAMLNHRTAGARHHYRVDLASTVERGTAALRAGHHRGYLVDHRVGPESGVGMIRRARDEGITLPIIMQTRAGVVEDEAAAAGANDFLVTGRLDTPARERAKR